MARPPWGHNGGSNGSGGLERARFGAKFCPRLSYTACLDINSSHGIPYLDLAPCTVEDPQDLRFMQRDLEELHLPP